MKPILLLFAILTSVCTLHAQPRGERGAGNPQEFQIVLIQKQLKLSEDQAVKFKTLYIEYSDEMALLRERPSKIAGASLTDQQIEAQILESFDMADKSTKLKREYYVRFKEILTPRQILRMYNIEREFRERLNAEHQRRKGGNSERE
ncbi:MAG: hypothetical protein R3Y08_02530 [Rikenellaceae bacterium]